MGDPAMSPSVSILDAQPSRISGSVRNVDATKVRIVGWAHTDRYYPQPFLDLPSTPICSDGSWSFFTHSWNRTIVLAVDERYEMPAGPPPRPSSIDYHPSTDPGVLAWAEIPPSPTLHFGDDTWWLKTSNGIPTGPGPCIFSAENVTRDGVGQVHVRIAQRGGTWTCAELVLDHSHGFGSYTFQVASPLDALAFSEVFGLFLFASPVREIDLECSPVLTGQPNGCQFVVQPFSTPGSRRIWPMRPVVESSHRIVWARDRLDFLSWEGFGPAPDPNDPSVLEAWTYTGPHIPPPGRERARIALWRSDGNPPEPGVGSDVVIRSFRYEPLPPSPQQLLGTLTSPAP